MKIIRRFALVLAGLAVLLVMLSALAFYLAVSDQPLVVSTKKSDPQALLLLKERVKQTINELYRRNEQKVISIRHHEVDEILALLSRTFPPVAAKYNYTDYQLLLGITIKLTRNPVGDYLNISIEFNDNKNLLTGTTRVGKLTFDNKTVFQISLWGTSLIIDEELVAVAEHLLTNASYSSNDISMSIDEDIDVRLLVAQLKHNLKMYTNIAWDDERFDGVAHYYQKLVDFSSYRSGPGKVSIVDFLKILYAEVGVHSRENNIVDANTNAFLALSMYAGDYNLRSFLSHITHIDLSQQNQSPRLLLANREDFLLHFLYSATIQILSSKGLSVALGELKEISDMDSGGSGFSFADLAADRAGIQFVTMAMDQAAAAHLQSSMANATSEEVFFPDIVGLKENLSLIEFTNEFRDIDSNEYRNVVQEIDRRIRLLPLYQFYARSLSD